MSIDLNHFSSYETKLGYKDPLNDLKKNLLPYEKAEVPGVIYGIRIPLERPTDIFKKLTLQFIIMKKVEIYKPKIKEMMEKVSQGIPWNEEDLKVVEESKKNYETAVKYGFGEQFLTELAGRPIKLWGSEITRSEAEKMVEERIQALREVYEKFGYDMKDIDSEIEELKKDFYTIIKGQYKIIDEK